MFGFQLSNIIPGFPRHTLYFVDPPYELLASQESENGQVSQLWWLCWFVFNKSLLNKNLCFLKLYIYKYFLP